MIDMLLEEQVMAELSGCIDAATGRTVKLVRIPPLRATREFFSSLLPLIVEKLTL
jgi:hypothetical protein